MKRLAFSVILLVAASVFSNVAAQRETPAGASDSDLRNNDVRLRSNEIERIRREAAKSDPNSSTQVNKEIAAKFPEIKEDFESIQTFQAAIIKAYSAGETIDYKMIGSSAGEVAKSAKRLDANLFIAKSKEKAGQSEEPEKRTKTVRELIVELDNVIADLVTSPMFQNLQVVDPEVARKAQDNLAAIMELSDQLSMKAGKM